MNVLDLWWSRKSWTTQDSYHTDLSSAESPTIHFTRTMCYRFGRFLVLMCIKGLEARQVLKTSCTCTTSCTCMTNDCLLRNLNLWHFLWNKQKHIRTNFIWRQKICCVKCVGVMTHLWYVGGGVAWCFMSRSAALIVYFCKTVRFLGICASVAVQKTNFRCVLLY